MPICTDTNLPDYRFATLFTRTRECLSTRTRRRELIVWGTGGPRLVSIVVDRVFGSELGHYPTKADAPVELYRDLLLWHLMRRAWDKRLALLDSKVASAESRKRRPPVGDAVECEGIAGAYVGAVRSAGGKVRYLVDVGGRIARVNTRPKAVDIPDPTEVSEEELRSIVGPRLDGFSANGSFWSILNAILPQVIDGSGVVPEDTRLAAWPVMDRTISCLAEEHLAPYATIRGVGNTHILLRDAAMPYEQLARSIREELVRGRDPREVLPWEANPESVDNVAEVLLNASRTILRVPREAGVDVARNLVERYRRLNADQAGFQQMPRHSISVSGTRSGRWYASSFTDAAALQKQAIDQTRRDDMLREMLAMTDDRIDEVTFTQIHDGIVGLQFTREPNPPD